MNTEDDRHIDQLIGNVLEDNVPADVDRRLRSQLEAFRSQLGEASKSPVCPPRTLGRRVWFGVSAAAAATIAAALIWWSFLPGVSLADVAAAVLKQPWIHVTETDPSGGKNELWYSPVKDVSAWHDKDWIEYRDHRVRVYYAYDLHDKVLYRVPEKMRRGTEEFAAVIASLQILLGSKQPVDNPLKRLGFPENEQTRYEVVKQRIVERQRMRDARLIRLRRDDIDLVGDLRGDAFENLEPRRVHAVVVGDENAQSGDPAGLASPPLSTSAVADVLIDAEVGNSRLRSRGRVGVGGSGKSRASIRGRSSSSFSRIVSATPSRSSYTSALWKRRTA